MWPGFQDPLGERHFAGESHIVYSNTWAKIEATMRKSGFTNIQGRDTGRSEQSVVLKAAEIKQTTLICQCVKIKNANHSRNWCPTCSYFPPLCMLHNHLHHRHVVLLHLLYTLCLVLKWPDVREIQGRSGDNVYQLCPKDFLGSRAALHCHLCLFLSEMMSLFFSFVILLRVVVSLVGRTGLAGAGGRWHHAEQDVKPKCFGAAGSIQHGELGERKVGGEGFQVLPEIRLLPNCLGSGFKMMKIRKGTLLASAEWMLRYGCSLTVKLSIL